MTTKKDRLMQQIRQLMDASILEHIAAGTSDKDALAAAGNERRRLLEHIENRLTAICRKADAYDGIRDGTTKGKSDADT